MLKFTVIAISVIQVAIGLTSAQTTRSLENIGFDSNQLHEIMVEGQDAYDLPSLQVAVVIDSTIVFSDATGYARFSDSLKATPETVYRAGSVTKPITATMLVKLAEEGIVRLDDPVEKYLPEYKPQSQFPGTAPTTLRQLATHQSGLPRSSPQEFLIDLATYSYYVEGVKSANLAEMTRESLMKSLPRLKLEYPPYSPYGHYSNLGYRILGLAIERASGEDFASYVNKNIFIPLGMTRSGFDPDIYTDGELAEGYVYTDSNAAPKAALVTNPGASIFSGGMYSTAEDLCRFLSLQFQTNPPGGKQIISSEGLRMMQWTAMDWGFSYAPDYPALEHGGSVPGFNAHVIIIPGLKLGIAVLSNRSDILTEQTPAKDIAWQIARQLKPIVADLMTAADKSPVISERGYIGKYVLGDNLASIEISKDGDSLYAEIPGTNMTRVSLYECAPLRLCSSGDRQDILEMDFDRIQGNRPIRLSVGEYHFMRME